MVVHNPLIRPYLLGGLGIGRVPLDSHDISNKKKRSKENILLPSDLNLQLSKCVCFCTKKTTLLTFRAHGFHDFFHGQIINYSLFSCVYILFCVCWYISLYIFLVYLCILYLSTFVPHKFQPKFRGFETSWFFIVMPPPPVFPPKLGGKFHLRTSLTTTRRREEWNLSLEQGCRFGPESQPNPGNQYLDP